MFVLQLHRQAHPLKASTCLPYVYAVSMSSLYWCVYVFFTLIESVLFKCIAVTGPLEVLP